jgi:thiol-disulfide isomerase/thioredoxin
MNLSRNFILWLLLTLPLLALTKNVTLKGKAKTFAGKTISVYKYADYITYSKQKIGSCKINTDETFETNINVSEVTQIILEIDDKSVTIYTESGKVYNLYINYNEELNKNRIYNKLLSVFFPFPQKNELNTLIVEFNSEYDKFMNENMIYLVKRDRQKVSGNLKIFKKNQLEKKSFTENIFAFRYATFVIGQVEASLNITRKEEHDTKYPSDEEYIYRNYFKNSPVLFNHPEYMNLFHNVFNEKFESIRLEKGTILIGALNEQIPIEKINNYLKKYPYFNNDTLLELFFLKGINETYNKKTAPKKYLLKILENYKQHGTCEQIKTIAVNVYNRLSNPGLVSGIAAPDFTLFDTENKPVNISDFKNKFLYIGFWATWSIPSIKEMSIIEQLHKKYNHKIEFISICTDGDASKIKRFLSKYPFKWHFLYYNNPAEIKEAYFVKTIPTYILINPDGSIYKAPAPRPTGNAERPNEESLEKVFYNITKAK